MEYRKSRFKYNLSDGVLRDDNALPAQSQLAESFSDVDRDHSKMLALASHLTNIT
jgi:hypothetical protein